MFPLRVPKIYKPTEGASVGESLFSTVIREISSFYNSVKNVFPWIGVFWKSSSTISRKSLLRDVSSLQFDSSYVT